jgi:hypothetical protein
VLPSRSSHEARAGISGTQFDEAAETFFQPSLPGIEATNHFILPRRIGLSISIKDYGTVRDHGGPREGYSGNIDAGI